MKKRILPLLLTFCMLLSLLPGTALAAGTAMVTSSEEFWAAAADKSVSEIRISGVFTLEPSGDQTELVCDKTITSEDTDGLKFADNVYLTMTTDRLNDCLIPFTGGATVTYHKDGVEYMSLGGPKGILKLVAKRTADQKDTIEKTPAVDFLVFRSNEPGTEITITEDISVQSLHCVTGENLTLKNSCTVTTWEVSLYDLFQEREHGEDAPMTELYQDGHCDLTVTKGCTMKMNENYVCDATPCFWCWGKIRNEGTMLAYPNSFHDSNIDCGYTQIAIAGDARTTDVEEDEDIQKLYSSPEEALKPANGLTSISLTTGEPKKVFLYSLSFERPEETDADGYLKESGWVLRPEGPDSIQGDGISIEYADDHGNVTLLAEKAGTYTLLCHGDGFPLTVTVTDPEPEPMPFTDVKEGAYYADAAAWAAKNEYVTGMTPTTFEPDTDCSRGMIVTVLWRYAGKPEPKTTTNPFTDVKESDYFYKAVLWAVENKIVTGMTPTTFEPDTKCSRAMAATLLYRQQGEPAVTGTSPFTDVAAGAYYANAALWASQKEIIRGTTDTTFAPDTTCARGMIVTMLYRLDQTASKEPELKTFEAEGVGKFLLPEDFEMETGDMESVPFVKYARFTRGDITIDANRFGKETYDALNTPLPADVDEYSQRSGPQKDLPEGGSYTRDEYGNLRVTYTQEDGTVIYLILKQGTEAFGSICIYYPEGTAGVEQIPEWMSRSTLD